MSREGYYLVLEASDPFSIEVKSYSDFELDDGDTYLRGVKFPQEDGEAYVANGTLSEGEWHITSEDRVQIEMEAEKPFKVTFHSEGSRVVNCFIVALVMGFAPWSMMGFVTFTAFDEYLLE